MLQRYSDKWVGCGLCSLWAPSQEPSWRPSQHNNEAPAERPVCRLPIGPLRDRGWATRGNVPLCQLVFEIREMFGKAMTAGGEWWGMFHSGAHLDRCLLDSCPLLGGEGLESGLMLAWLPSRDLRPHVPWKF